MDLVKNQVDKKFKVRWIETFSSVVITLYLHELAMLWKDFFTL